MSEWYWGYLCGIMTIPLFYVLIGFLPTRYNPYSKI